MKIIGFITAPQTKQFKVVLQDYSSSIELVFDATYCIPVKSFFKVGAYHMIKKCFVVKKVSKGYYTATSHDYFISVDKSFDFDDFPKISPDRAGRLTTLKVCFSSLDLVHGKSKAMS